MLVRRWWPPLLNGAYGMRCRIRLLSVSDAVCVACFVLTAYTDPSELRLSAAIQEQYYTGPSSGFGISEAARGTGTAGCTGAT